MLPYIQLLQGYSATRGGKRWLRWGRILSPNRDHQEPHVSKSSRLILEPAYYYRFTQFVGYPWCPTFLFYFYFFMERLRFISISWNVCIALLSRYNQASFSSTSSSCSFSSIIFVFYSLLFVFLSSVCSVLLSGLLQALALMLFLYVKGRKSLPSAVSCGFLCLFLDWFHGFIILFCLLLLTQKTLHLTHCITYLSLLIDGSG